MDKSKICLIKQSAGIGDIFFLLKMADFYIKKGYYVIFPILPQLMFIADYVKMDNLEFCSTDSNFPYKEEYNIGRYVDTEKFIMIPAQTSFNGKSCMESKYEMIGLDFNNWQDYFSFIRNTEKENELFYNVLGLDEKTNYTFISKTWGTQPKYATKEVYYESKEKVIEMSFIDGYTLFDWSKVIENANEISIVDTSTNYIIEKLNLKAQKLFLNSRFTPSNFSHIINLFKKDWIYV